VVGCTLKPTSSLTTTVWSRRDCNAVVSNAASTANPGAAATHVPSESSNTVPRVSRSVATTSLGASMVDHCAGRRSRCRAIRDAMSASVGSPVAT
jgi:hypothetical protein